MSEAPTRGRFGKRSCWFRWGLAACAVLAAFSAATWLATPWYVRTRLLPRLWAQYGLTLTAEQQDVSIADGTTALYGVRLFDGDEEVLSAKRVEMRLSLRGLYEGRTVFERVVLDAPVLHAHLGVEGTTNVGKILGRRTHDPAAARPAPLWKQALVRGGTVEWDDRAHGVKLRIVDIDAAVLDMETGSGERQDRFGQISVDANLQQASHETALLSIVHWTTDSGGTGRSFVAHAALTGIDLDSFPGYVDGTQRASLGVDHLDLVVSMDVREGIIRRGAAVATSPERTRALTLLFSGPLGDPVFDRSSKLLELWELPFSRLGRVGDVVWDTGGAVVGGAIGAVDGIVHGDLLGAGESAAGGVGGGILALGSATLDALSSLGRALGIVAEEEARDTRRLHNRQRALLLNTRRDAARAWSRAHPEAREEGARSDGASTTGGKP